MAHPLGYRHPHPARFGPPVAPTVATTSTTRPILLRLPLRRPAPPDASILHPGQLLTELRPPTTFDANAFNEVRATAAAPLGAGGYNPPTLLSLAFPQTFFHNGSVNTLEAVILYSAVEALLRVGRPWD